jgi:uncharacterized protein involved in outer membrane biogenesis
MAHLAPDPSPASGRTASPRGSRRRLKRWALALGAGCVALLAAAFALLLIDANALRAPLARFLAAKLERPVAIHGDLRIGLRSGLRLEAGDIVVGNAEWGSRPTMLTVERAAIRLRLRPLLAGRIVLPEVEAIKPDVLLERSKEGIPNWRFSRPSPPSAPSAAGRWGPPEVQSLVIQEGRLQFIDPLTRSDVVLQIDSARQAVATTDSAAAEAVGIGFVGRGRVRGRDFALEGRAGSLLELTREGEPYRLDVSARAGDTKASFHGTVVPFNLESIHGRLELSGKDLSKLYPLVPVALPWTSTYRISGRVQRSGREFGLQDLNGRVGGSDVQGSASLDLSSKRPFFSADVTSRRLDYKDLAGFLGAPPPAQGGRRPPDQEREARLRQASDRALPDKPYDVSRLQAFDADVRFKARSIIASSLPLDNMVAHLKLKDGTLVLAPLDFGVAGGHVVSQVRLDSREDSIQAVVEATATNLEAKALLPALKRSPGSAGKVGGRARLSAAGSSIAEMAGSANGEIALIMSQGRASTLSLVLVNLDLANAAKYVLYGDPNAPVHCGVITAKVQDGVAVPETFVIDSSEERITGGGKVDFKRERYALRLVADSKRASVVALRGPIRIGGTFKHPQVRPELGPVIARVGAAVALGIVATPLAALLPLVDPGDAKSADCRALLEHARKEVPAPSSAAPKAPRRQAPAEPDAN